MSGFDSPATALASAFPVTMGRSDVISDLLLFITITHCLNTIFYPVRASTVGVGTNFRQRRPNKAKPEVYALRKPTE